MSNNHLIADLWKIEVTPALKLVLLSTGFRVTSTGVGRVSFKAVADETGLSVDDVVSSFSSLSKLGLLSIYHADGSPIPHNPDFDPAPQGSEKNTTDEGSPFLGLPFVMNEPFIFRVNRPGRRRTTQLQALGIS